MMASILALVQAGESVVVSCLIHSYKINSSGFNEVVAVIASITCPCIVHRHVVLMVIVP